ncbi:MAG: hypothetical protein OHK0021_14920 [Bryobacter sp.]
MKLATLNHELSLDALALGTALSPLLEQYTTSPVAQDLAPRVSVQLHLYRPGTVNAVWSAAPRDGSAGFLRAMTKLSVEIQRAFRNWLQLLWVSDLDNLRDTDRSAQVAAYLALRPFYPKSKNAYGYDLLEDGCLKSIERNVKLYISGVLEVFSTRLRLAGEHALADFYAPRHANWFVENALKSPKHLYEILAREEKLIRLWAPFLGREASELDSEIKWESAREEVASHLRAILRRDDDWRFLAPLFEMEATAGLERHLDWPVTRRLEIFLRPLGEPHTRANVIPFPTRLAA